MHKASVGERRIAKHETSGTADICAESFANIGLLLSLGTPLIRPLTRSARACRIGGWPIPRTISMRRTLAAGCPEKEFAAATKREDRFGTARLVGMDVEGSGCDRYLIRKVDEHPPLFSRQLG